MSQTLTYSPPVISVDVEDWPQSSWDRDLPITPRAAQNTERILSVLGASGVRATMFVLGKFAQTFPAVVKRVRAEGHEVACHGHGHIEIFKQSREEFAVDLSRAKNILEDILGEPVKGYRAPDFSVVRGTLWALEVIAELGFEYDSSIFPVRRPRYGIPDWPISPVRLCFGGSRELFEVPIATFRYWGKNWPVGGGGYHRLLPGFMSRSLARTVMSSAPFIFYCHPYELDPAEFKEIFVKVPMQVRLHQGLGRRWFTQRLGKFLKALGGSAPATKRCIVIGPKDKLTDLRSTIEDFFRQR